MASSVDLCNDALSYLGQEGNITSIDPPDNSAHARTMARLFSRARSLVLASGHNWQFATKRSSTLADTGSNLPMWEYAYQPPSDLVKPLSVLSAESSSDDAGLPFLFENGLVYCNAEAVVLRYVYAHTVTPLWPAPFGEAVARKLAVLASSNIVRGADPRLYEILERNAAIALAVAGEHDGTTIDREDTYQPPWIRARK